MTAPTFAEIEILAVALYESEVRASSYCARDTPEYSLHDADTRTESIIASAAKPLPWSRLEATARRSWRQTASRMVAEAEQDE